MEEEPFFLVNEFLEKEKEDIQKIIKSIEIKNVKKYEKAVFLRNFTNELFKANRKNKKLKTEEVKKVVVEHKDTEKELLLKKKEELIKKLNSLQPVKAIVEKNDVVLSKETGRSLVTTEFDGNSYTVKEPEIGANDLLLINELKSKNLDLEDKENLINNIKELSTKYNINYNEDYYDKIRYYLVRDVKKYGKISPLIEDKNVKEIVCGGSSKPLLVTYQDKRDVNTNVVFNSEEELNQFILVMTKRLNLKISPDNPFFNAVLDNITIQGTFGSEFIKAKFVIAKN